MRCRVAVTGMGLVSPFGSEPEGLFAHMLRGDSAIRSYSLPDVPHPLAIPAARCIHFDPLARLGRPLAYSMDRFSQLGVASAFSAWKDAGLAKEEIPERDDCGIYWGTAVGGSLTFEHGYRKLYLANRAKVAPLTLIQGMNSSAASQIAIELGLGGPCLTFSVACASSSVAIGEAFRRIRAGDSQLMLAGGSEAPLAYGVVRAWNALGVLAPGDEENAWRACRPFGEDRSGIVLGEGAAALVLEEWEHALTRGAHIYAELAGYGTSCDRKHLVRPDSAGQVRAILKALADAGLTSDEIDYVNAHGTATREGDPTEIAALKSVFGPRAARLPVSATKSMHGHMLGATGAIEAIIAILALRQQIIPPTAHLERPASSCEGVHHIMGEPMHHAAMHAALSNSFAFGGSNAVLAFRASATDLTPGFANG